MYIFLSCFLALARTWVWWFKVVRADTLALLLSLDENVYILLLYMLLDLDFDRYHLSSFRNLSSIPRFLRGFLNIYKWLVKKFKAYFGRIIQVFFFLLLLIHWYFLSVKPTLSSWDKLQFPSNTFWQAEIILFKSPSVGPASGSLAN